ncbi:hypothetical protein K474DRAFT_1586573 [Panus rudis PR-1116 ss-1]|nr:hypothetical protein K474DRAFT_1586573 [Panus rudis PR-1116 ss-1]
MAGNEKGSAQDASRPETPLHERLPSYEDLRAEANLKHAFARLVHDQEEIQRLFLSVAAQLETTPNIGEGHHLCNEWDQLRKKHNKTYRESQLNASQCASFLNNYSTILVPLSKGRMTIEQKRMMINKFIEAIPAHEESARDVEAKFQELAKDVEVFPIKVSAYLKSKADSESFWGSLWSGLGELCMSIWDALHKLFSAIVQTFQDLLSNVRNIRVCAPFVNVTIEMSVNTSRLSQTARRGSLGQARRDCKEIVEHLTGFQDAWHLVRLACNNLLDGLVMARGVSTLPDAFNANLKNVEIMYTPLVQCLNAYSRGKSPSM